MFESKRIKSTPAWLRWHFTSIAPGESMKGWIAGPLVVADVHWDMDQERNQPCWDWATKGALRCRCMDAPIPTRTGGYLPLITKEKDKLVIWVSKKVAAVLQLWAHGTCVEFFKPKKPKQPLSFKQILPDQLGLVNAKNMRDHQPEDIRPFLLHLWQDRILSEHFGIGLDGEPLTPICTPAADNSLGADPPARDNALSPAPVLFTNGKPKTTEA